MMKNINTKFIQIFFICLIIFIFSFFIQQEDKVENFLIHKNEKKNTKNERSAIFDSNNISPFGERGDESLVQKDFSPVFPQLDWKDRSVYLFDGRVFYYTFGSGNPDVLQISSNERSLYEEKCLQGQMTPLIFCNSESGKFRNMNSEVEKFLLLALSDPNWTHLAFDCKNAFILSDQNTQIHERYIDYQTLFSSGFLDINSFIQVDKQTGWKYLEEQKIIYIINYLLGATKFGYKNSSSWENQGGDCVDIYASGIIQNFSLALNFYQSSFEEGLSNSGKLSIPNIFY